MKSTEIRFLRAEVPENRVKKIDTIINQFISKNCDEINSSTLQKWKLRIENMKLEGFERMKGDDLFKKKEVL